jgi:P2 family phage major capsid protein
MRNATRIAFTALAAQIALVNGVASATEKFNVAPTVQQTLEKATQESSAFLKAINIIGVDEQQGEALLAGVNGPVASRTNTGAGNRRNPANVAEMSKDSYSCVQTNFDTSFPYALLDAWAKFPEFQVLLTNAIVERQALDRIMIGFNGKLVAVATDRATSPLLQDVNKGWLQKIREGAADRVLDEGAVAGKIRVGAIKIVKVAGVNTEITGDYQTLDGVVFDAIQMLDPWHRARPDLVVLVSRDLMHEKLLKAVETDAMQELQRDSAYGVPAFRLTVDGKDIARLISPRLMSLEHTDNRGLEADQLSITLSDHDGLLEIPPKGAVVKLWMGWSDTGLVDKGSYTVDETEHSGAPDILSIRARSADLRGSLKTKRERSWSEVTAFGGSRPRSTVSSGTGAMFATA